MMNFPLPEPVFECISTIEARGYEAWVVGGCVRDMTLKKTPIDYDAASSAPPNQLVNMFKRVIETGIKHGTVTVLINKMPIEVTQFRIDGEYIDHRRPSATIATDNLEMDLSRRDFTINAMAYHPERGIADPFCGQKDIENRIIKAVGEPERRFNEDALRIMRAFRFSCQLDFGIEKETEKKALELSPLLKKISAERVFSELIKALISENPSNMESLIRIGGLSFAGIDYSAPLSALKIVPNTREMRFAAFCFLCKSDSDEVCERLKTDKKLKIISNKIISLLNKPLFKKSSDIKRAFTVLEPEWMVDFLHTRNALFDENVETQIELVNKILKENQAWKTEMLEIKGKDLEEIGIFDKKIGDILNKLLAMVIENPALNTHEKLINLAKTLINE